MQGWQTSYLGLRDMPGDISEFELQAFFSFSRATNSSRGGAATVSSWAWRCTLASPA